MEKAIERYPMPPVPPAHDTEGIERYMKRSEPYIH